MTSLLNNALESMSTWLGVDAGHEDEGSFTFYCDCERLIEIIVEKAREKNNCVDIDQKHQDSLVQTSPSLHKKCPTADLLKTSKVQPYFEEENALQERLLRHRAESGELGVKVGDGVLCLQFINDPADCAAMLIKRVNDASSSTLRSLAELPPSSSTILAVCFDATKEEMDRIESAVKGPALCWKVGRLPLHVDEEEKEDDENIEEQVKTSLTDQDFEAFIAVARATAVLHMIQDAGL